MITHFFFRFRFFRGSSSRNQRAGQIGGILMLLGLVLIVLSPLLANLIKLAISRKREFLADASGALLTRYPEGLARALEKISEDPRSMKVASDATSHLFVVNPFKGKESRSWLHRVFLTHPPLQDRVRALRGMRV
jgi:heat shock protein HtpX